MGSQLPHSPTHARGPEANKPGWEELPVPQEGQSLTNSSIAAETPPPPVAMASPGESGTSSSYGQRAGYQGATLLGPFHPAGGQKCMTLSFSLSLCLMLRVLLCPEGPGPCCRGWGGGLYAMFGVYVEEPRVLCGAWAWHGHYQGEW